MSNSDYFSPAKNFARTPKRWLPSLVEVSLELMHEGAGDDLLLALDFEGMTFD